MVASPVSAGGVTITRTGPLGRPVALNSPRTLLVARTVPGTSVTGGVITPPPPPPPRSGGEGGSSVPPPPMPICRLPAVTGWKRMLAPETISAALSPRMTIPLARAKVEPGGMLPPVSELLQAGSSARRADIPAASATKVRRNHHSSSRAANRAVNGGQPAAASNDRAASVRPAVSAWSIAPATNASRVSSSSNPASSPFAVNRP